MLEDAVEEVADRYDVPLRDDLRDLARSNAGLRD